MKTVIRQSIMWISVSAAAIAAIIVTKSEVCICALLIPAFVEFGKTGEEIQK